MGTKAMDSAFAWWMTTVYFHEARFSNNSPITADLLSSIRPWAWMCLILDSDSPYLGPSDEFLMKLFD